MGGQTWSLTARVCDSCKAGPAAVFCRADSAFLCLACDARVHAANKLASRHARVWVCEVCEQAPAAVTCKADAAALCQACDRDIHSANPLARRHERVPVEPFYDAASASAARSSPRSAAPGEEFSEEEVEAASWLLPDPAAKGEVEEEEEQQSGSPEYKSEYLFSDMDPYLDLDLMISGDPKHGQVAAAEQQKQYSADGVVPVQNSREDFGPGQYPGQVVDGYPSYDVDYHTGSKPFLYNFTSQTISQSVSSSSMEVGVVPEHNVLAELSDAFAKTEAIPVPVSGIDREARVLRYREKRKNRRFEKTIRYASRKAYAETRPRIKGRFAKRSELQVADASYSVVPSF